MAEEDKKAYFESDAGDGTKAKDQHLTGFPLISCIFACLCCLFLTALDQTIVVTILETISNKFGKFELIGWLSSGFLLSTCVFQAVWGKLSIIFGRKYVFMACVLIFEGGSLICALSNSMEMLIGGRIIAGIGGGGIQALNSIIVTEVVTIKQRSIANSLFGVVFSLSSVIGPLLGGVFTNKLSWRWCFYINLPIGGFSLLLLLTLFHPPRPKLISVKEKLLKIDLVGIVLIAIGLVFLLLALSFGGTDQFAWDSGLVISFFIIGGLGLTAFCLWNFKYCDQTKSMIPLEIVKVLQINAAAFSLGFSFFFYMGLLLYLGTYFQVVKNYDALESGISLLPLIVTVSLTSVSSGILMKVTRFVKPFAIFGAVLGPLGCGILALLKTDSTSSARIGLLIPAGISMGLQFQTRILEGQLSAPKTSGALILTTSYLNFFRTFGGTIGAEICQTVFNTSFQSRIVKFEDVLKITRSEALDLISSPKKIRLLSSSNQEIVLDCVMGSLHNVFYTCMASASIALFCSFFTTNKRIPKVVE